MAGVQELQRLVEDRLHALGDRNGPLSARAAAQRSKGQVSYETLRLIAKGEHSGRLSEDVAAGIAPALDVPLSHVLKAAGRTVTQPLPPFKLPREADRLTRSQRAAIVGVIRAMLEPSPMTDEQVQQQEHALARRLLEDTERLGLHSVSSLPERP